ncbi:MAG: gamma-glutamyl-gamma-aminobutyrate hydrolase family protein [Bdellovibrionota bacterium]
MRIGISSCFFHADPQRAIFKGKTLLYLEQSLGHWVQSQGVMAYTIPTIPEGSALKIRDYVQDLDGLVLQGGSDVSPKSYGEQPLKAEWGGDFVRDQYEIALAQEFMTQKKPVLGVCRGLQLLNVAFGGTLVQDIGTQLETAVTHRNWDVYDQNFHSVVFTPGSIFNRLYPNRPFGKVNSIHHQAIKDLGKDLAVEARSEKDSMIEAIRWKGPSYVVAVQWHPEFHDPHDSSLLDSKPLLHDFLNEAKRRKKG